MTVLFQHRPIFVYSFSYTLGSVRRSLIELKQQKLLLGTVEALSALGYEYNFGVPSGENLLSLTKPSVAKTLGRLPDPRALVFQHCYAESAVLPYHVHETDIASRNRYFPAEVMRALALDHLPYFCSFASGCAGFISLLGLAGGLFLASSNEAPLICVMADCMPSGVPYDMLEERILGSDHSSAFAIGPEQCGYQLLGIGYYSTARTKVAFVEIVKRTVDMIQDLTLKLGLDLSNSEVALHYPNIFPDTWKMVTRYLRISHVEHVVDGMAERAHCMASDSVISLKKCHRGQEGRIHIVVNYGVGLHLGMCVLREQASAEHNGGGEPDGNTSTRLRTS